MSHRSAAKVAATAIVLWGAAASAQTAPAPDPSTPAASAPDSTQPVITPPASTPDSTRPVITPPASAPDSTQPAIAEPKTTQPGTPVALASTPGQAMTTLHGWKGTFYGFVEFDAIRDSTQSFGDSVGNTPLLRTDGSIPSYITPLFTPTKSYASTNPRVIFTPRNTTFGFRVEPPEVGNVRLTSVIEFDFFGNQPTNPLNSDQGNSPTTEGSYLSSATPRMRHAYVEAKTPIVDVLAGQAYNLFAWEPLFFPATDSFLGLPNMIFDRRAQIRLTKRLESRPVTVTVAGAALRPAQADSGFPDLVGGLLFQINDWKGAHMLGPSQPKHDALSIGVSGIYRQFKVAQWQNNGGDPGLYTEQAASANGSGFSIDALIPIIPVKDIKDRRNGLTVTGSFVSGTGIGDLYTGGLTGGATFPVPPNQGVLNTGTYGPNIDPGVVQYSVMVDPVTGTQVLTNGAATGVLRTLNWRTYMAGLQYYLPFLDGRFVITGNYTRAQSDNMLEQQAPNPACGNSSGFCFAVEKNAGGNPTRTYRAANYYDANLFMGITDSLKIVLSWQRVEQIFLAHGLAGQEVMGDSSEHNDRFEFSTFFFF